MLEISRLRDDRLGHPHHPFQEGPVPGSVEELEQFARLQRRLVDLFRDIFPHPRHPRTVIVIPSLSLDKEYLAKITGVRYYEERLLCMLMLLRLPHTRLVYVTSSPLDPSIIDYYLHLLPGIPSSHARRRLTLLTCHDASSTPLTQKILQRPRLLNRIKQSILDVEGAHITCFNATPAERTLAVRLDVPLYACDPKLTYLGTKSGSRDIFMEAGLEPPDGFAHLRDEHDLVEAMVVLKNRNPNLLRAVVKQEVGASGEGNAIFSFEGCPKGSSMKKWIKNHLPVALKFEAKGERWQTYKAKFEQVGGIVECFVEGAQKRSPSVQCRINPVGEVKLVSTHDQVLGGPSGQIFQGCTFPADEAYRVEIQRMGLRVAHVLHDKGALGRFGIDFISIINQDGTWQHYPIEINLRKGGTTHPFLMLQFLTDGTFDPEEGLYFTPTGRPRFYFASDNLENPAYRGLTPDDLIDIAVENSLHFHGATQQGVVFHLIGTLSEFGKLGLVCISASHQGAQKLYRETVEVLRKEASGYGETVPVDEDETTMESEATF